MNQMQISKTDIQKKENLEEALCLQAERYRLIKEINQELAKLIYQGGDVNDSLNETLERIGNQYGLRLAAVLEYEGKKREQVWTNCWCLDPLSYGFLAPPEKKPYGPIPPASLSQNRSIPLLLPCCRTVRCIPQNL